MLNIQVDLESTHIVHAVATQGRIKCTCNQWVTSYKMAVYFDSVHEIKYYKNDIGKDKVLIYNFMESYVLSIAHPKPKEALSI